MKKFGLMFNSEMVLGAQNRRKFQTRRLVTSKNTVGLRKHHDLTRCTVEYSNKDGWEIRTPRVGEFSEVRESLISRIQPGDRIWVRETWRLEWADDAVAAIGYKSDEEVKKFPAPFEFLNKLDQPNDNSDRWRPSMHMPMWAARIELEVDGVRLQFLQDISKFDCIAEGMQGLEDVHAGWHEPFAALWDRTSPRGKKWNDNPLVWAYEFKVL